MADGTVEAEIEGILAEAQIALKAKDRRRLITTLSRAMAKASDL